MSHFKKLLYLFRVREREREREGEKHRPVASHTPPQLGTWSTTQACVLTRNRTSDFLVCRLVFNSLSYPSQGQCGLFNKFSFLYGKWDQIIIYTGT